MPGGRKSVLEKQPEAIDRVLRHIANGLSHKRACAAAGINYGTFENALVRGRKDDAPQALRELVESVEAAFDAGIGAKVDMIVAHGFDDWRAIAWLLARQDPDVYGAISRVRLGGDPSGVPVRTEMESSIDFTGWEPDRIRAYIELVEGTGLVEIEDE
jgi:hypothetical protein